MKKTGAAAIGAGIGMVALGPLGALAGGAIGAWLGKNKDEAEVPGETTPSAAIVCAPDGVRLTESNMTIPWKDVYLLDLDEDNDTLRVLFVGGLVAFSEDYDHEDGLDRIYPDEAAEDDDMEEEAMREAIEEPDGCEVLKAEWERRLTSVRIAIGAFDNASPENTYYDSSYSVPSAIDFGKVYVDLADGMRRQIADPEQVEAVLGYWLAIKEGIETKDKDDRKQIRELKALIAELKATSAPVEAPAALPAASDGPAQGTYTREEALFLKRARRYATNDGEIDAKERADLEALAMKMGIDELRTEELIEEAFGQ